MRIKDLPQAESILDSVFFAVDSEADGTRKVTKAHLLSGIEGEITSIEGDISDIQEQLADVGSAIRVDISTFSTLPQIFSSASITADMVLFGSWLTNPEAQIGDWTVTTAAGSVTVSGDISGSTALTLILGKA